MGIAFNHNPRTCLANTLAMKRVGHYGLRADKLVKAPTCLKADLVAQLEFFLKRAIWRHPVIVAAREIADFRVKR